MPIELSTTGQTLIKLSKHYQELHQQQALNVSAWDLTEQECRALGLPEAENLKPQAAQDFFKLVRNFERSVQPSLTPREVALVLVFLNRSRFNPQKNPSVELEWHQLYQELARLEQRFLSNLVQGYSRLPRSELKVPGETAPSNTTTPAATFSSVNQNFAEATLAHFTLSSAQADLLSRALFRTPSVPRVYQRGMLIFLKNLTKKPHNPAALLDLILYLEENLPQKSDLRPEFETLRVDYQNLLAQWGYPVGDLSSSPAKGFELDETFKEAHITLNNRSPLLEKKLRLLQLALQQILKTSRLNSAEIFEARRALLTYAYLQLHPKTPASDSISSCFKATLTLLKRHLPAQHALWEQLKPMLQKEKVALDWLSPAETLTSAEKEPKLKTPKPARSTNPLHQIILTDEEIHLLEMAIHGRPRLPVSQRKYWERALRELRTKPKNPIVLFDLLFDLHRYVPSTHPLKPSIDELWAKHLELCRSSGYAIDAAPPQSEVFQAEERWKDLHLKLQPLYIKPIVKKLRELLQTDLTGAERFEAYRALIALEYVRSHHQRLKSESEMSCLRSALTLIQRHRPEQLPAWAKINLYIRQWETRAFPSSETPPRPDSPSASVAERSLNPKPQALASTSPAPGSSQRITVAQMQSAYQAWKEAPRSKTQRAQAFCEIVLEYLKQENPQTTPDFFSERQIFPMLRAPQAILDRNPLGGFQDVAALFPAYRPSRLDELQSLQREFKTSALPDSPGKKAREKALKPRR